MIGKVSLLVVNPACDTPALQDILLPQKYLFSPTLSVKILSPKFITEPC